MAHEPMRADTDILVIGSGAAGMYAAIEAARRGCRVLLADRSLIGRGGATVMAQMTVAAALASETPDHWSHHYDDTLTAGRGLCNKPLAQLLCEEGPECIRTMDDWGIGLARKDGHITQAMAPGHDRPRCVYVDFLNTGPAVSKTLRTVVNKTYGIRKAGDLCIVDLLRSDGDIVGAAALHLGSGAPAILSAKATILGHTLRGALPTPEDKALGQQLAYEAVHRLVERPESVVGCLIAWTRSGTVEPIPLHALAPKPFDWELFARMHGNYPSDRQKT